MINATDQEKLLLSIARSLKRKVKAFAVGGTAMMFHGLKDTTKDIDLVFTGERDRDEFRKAAMEMGYSGYDPVKVYGAKRNRPVMLTRGDEERFDLFMTEVIDFVFSEAMIRRATDVHEFGKSFELHIADPHDIILMKCATDRLKDKDDARQIIGSRKIDWGIIIEEAQSQVRLGKKRALWDLEEFVSELIKMRTPIPREALKRIRELIEESWK